MSNPLRIALVTIICLTCSAQAQKLGSLGEDEKEAHGTFRYKGRGIADIEWSATKTKDGDSETITRVLHSLTGDNKRSLIQEEETRTRIDSETTKVTRTTSNFDSRGNTRIAEVVEEQLRVLANGEEHAERIISTPDSRGRLSVYRQEVQSSIPVGPNATQSLTSVYLKNSRGEFEEQERKEQSESHSGNTTEIEETTLEIDANGRWASRSKRTVTTTKKEGQLEREEERVYRKDSRGRLELSEYVVTTSGEDERGNPQLTVETHSRTIGGTRRTSGGKLALTRRVNTINKTLSGGVDQTIKEVEEKSLADPSAGLEIVERTITTSRPLRGGGKEIEIEVQARDSHGRFRTVMTQKTSVQ